MRHDGEEGFYGMKSYRADNHGFSLVELIIVVSIMALMISVMGYGLSLSSGKPAEECARKFAASIQHGRMTTMGKYRNIITVSKDAATGKIVVSEEIVTQIDDTGAEHKVTRTNNVGSRQVTFEYSTDGGSTFTELTPGSSITLRFDSGSGALKKTGPGDTYYANYKISKANKTMYVLIETLTGRVVASDTPPTSP